jgi:hypothetical protein
VGSLFALAAGSAHASTTQESVLQDDGQFVFGSPDVRARAFNDASELGVDTLRINVMWRRVAPAAGSRERPGFDATNPGNYELGAYDDAVRQASARGINVLFTVTGPGPDWASGCSSTADGTCKPDAGEFGQFVRAVGTRYSGAFGGVPRVSRWSIYNEPNVTGWLSPQFERKSGRTVPSAPHQYRDLFRAGQSALAGTGHGGDQILLGETGPVKTSRQMPPAQFYRELFCLDSRGKRLSTSARRSRGCPSSFKLAATGVAHHPYNASLLGTPTSRPRGRDDITISTLSRLSSVLSQGARAKRIRSRPPIYLTEFGFQSQPGERFGASLTRHAQYINEADYTGWRNSQVRSVGQYQLIDEDVGDFELGLRLADFTAKPAVQAYKVPIVVQKGRRSYTVWGQVRPGGATSVAILNKGRVVKTVRTNSRGYFRTTTSKRSGSWQLRAASGLTSRVASAR